MNILEHINAGHYERDEKGRALVPMPNDEKFVVAHMDAPGRFPLLGWHLSNNIITQYGVEFCEIPDPHRLLPPPTRKVKLEGWACVYAQPKGKAEISWSRDQLIRNAGPDPDNTRYRLVPMSGEYEEPWS